MSSAPAPSWCRCRGVVGHAANLGAALAQSGPIYAGRPTDRRRHGGHLGRPADPGGERREIAAGACWSCAVLDHDSARCSPGRPLPWSATRGRRQPARLAACHGRAAGAARTRVVPGHGPPSAPWPDAARPQRDYLLYLRDQVRAGRRNRPSRRLMVTAAQRHLAAAGGGQSCTQRHGELHRARVGIARGARRKEPPLEHHRLDRSRPDRRHHRQFLHPGPDPGGFFLTIVIGIVGALIGGFLSTTMGFGDVSGVNLPSLVIAVLGSLILLILFRMMRRNA